MLVILTNTITFKKSPGGEKILLPITFDLPYAFVGGIYAFDFVHYV